MKKIVYYLFLIFAVSFFIYFILPLPDDLKERRESPILLSEDGHILWFSVNEIGQYKYSSDSDLPNKIKTATRLYEDEFFYYHPGFNPISMAKAIIHNLKGNKIRGASTITMQCARIYFGNPDRTLMQKIKELIFALKLEWKWSKEEIFRWYLNNAPYGKNYIGYYAASLAYFGKNPENLSWAEAASLSVIPQNPSGYYPGKNHGLLIKKRNHLLYKLYKKGFIRRDEWMEALMEKLSVSHEKLPLYTLHLYDYFKKTQNFHGTIKTFIKFPLQIKIQNIVNQFIERYAVNEVRNISVIVAEADSGKVRAYVGNGDFTLKNPNFWIDHNARPRSSGSTLKPLLFALALEKKIIYPDSWLSDIPEYFGNYDPGNAGGTFDGVVPASDALARSLNVPFVELIRETGIPVFIEKLKHCGINSINKPSDHYGLSVILGAAEVSPNELTLAYVNLLNASQNKKLRFNELTFSEIHNRNKAIRKENVFDPASAYAALKSMKEFRYQKFHSERFNNKYIYYKTGTSFGYRDAWAVGTNGKYVVCVWVGNADGEGRPGLTGKDYAVPVFIQIMQNLEGKIVSFPKAFFKKTTVCSLTGYEMSEECHELKSVLVPSCSYPSKKCGYHKVILTDAEHKFRYNADCAPLDAIREAFLVLRPEQEMYYKMKNPFFISIPPVHPKCISDEKKDFEIVYPKNNLRIMLSGILGSSNVLVLKAASRNKKNFLKWYLNDVFQGQTRGIHHLEIKPEKGVYKLKVIDINGNEDEVFFEVI